MLADIEASKRELYVPRGRGRFDLVHAGRPQDSQMAARLDAFLARYPDLQQRENAQIVREFARRGAR